MTLRDLLNSALVANPSRPFLFFRDRSFTLQDVVRHIDACAAGLHGIGVCSGHHVAVVLPNRPEFLYAWFALATLGAVVVPINPALTPRELHAVLLHSDAVGLVAESDRLEACRDACAGTRVRWLFAVGTPLPGTYALNEFVRRPAPRPPVRQPDGRAIASLMYTSGTTGAPRGVLKTHGSYTSVATREAGWLAASESDRFFSCLPLFHTSAQINFLTSLAAGGTFVLGERFSASSFWQTLRAHEVTIFNYIGTMLAILAKRDSDPIERQHRVRVAVGGGADARLERLCLERFHIALVEGYGLTETSFVTVRPFGSEAPPGSAGRPVDYCRVRILDESGANRPADAIGEIVVSQSDVLTAGYYKDPLATATALRDGWFHTGDLGWLDPDGFLFFAGRKKDVIRRRGENVSPTEVEGVLLMHDAVAEAAVVGRPSDVHDEDVCAVVVLAPGSHTSAEELLSFCRARLAPYKVPATVTFRGSLPKTDTQKVRREVLRSELSALQQAGEDA